MYKIKVNRDYNFQLKESNGEFSYEGKDIAIDIQPVTSTYFHILYKSKSFRVELIEHREAEKVLLLKINSKEYLVEVADQYDELLHQLGLDKTISKHITELKAPMPGLVLKILVKEGDRVSKGDTVIILEAMKMENSIKSPVDSMVKTIKVSVGDKLEKNQVMIGF